MPYNFTYMQNLIISQLLIFFEYLLVAEEEQMRNNFIFQSSESISFICSLSFGYKMNNFLFKNTKLSEFKQNKQKLALSKFSREIFPVRSTICQTHLLTTKLHSGNYLAMCSDPTETQITLSSAPCKSFLTTLLASNNRFFSYCPSNLH